MDVGNAPTITANRITGETNYTSGQNAPYSTAASSRPTIAHSSEDTLFVVYEGAVNNTVRINNDYRDLYVAFSTDGGSSWSDPQNLTQTAEDGGESVFASAYKSIVNNKLHLIWQEDVFPGTSVGIQSVQRTISDNSILYAGVDVDAIIKDSLRQDTTVNDTTTGVFIQKSKDIGSLAVYPNPVKDNQEINANLTLKETANVTYKVVNTLGQVRYRENLGTVSAGSQNIQLPSLDLAKGVYFLQFNVNDRTLTRKFLRR